MSSIPILSVTAGGSVLEIEDSGFVYPIHDYIVLTEMGQFKFE